MTQFHPDYQDDESSRAPGTPVPLNADAGPGGVSADELSELELDGELDTDMPEEARAATEPQTREAYLKKGEDLIRSLL
jgi:hypothetical protein